jgi:hypothetical protein
MKLRIATFCVARSAVHCFLPGHGGSHGYPAPGFVEHLDCRVAHRLDAEVGR